MITLKKVKRSFRRLLILYVGMTMTVIAIVLVVRLIPESPEAEVMSAMEALARARQGNAGTYSPTTYLHAEEYYDSAIIHWKVQNERFILLRNFGQVEKYAGLSAAYSAMALEKAGQNSVALHSRLGLMISDLNEMVSHLDQHFLRFPLPAGLRKAILQGKLLLSEAERAFARGEYLQAENRVSEADPLIRRSFITANDELNEYFSSYNQWKKWFDATVAESGTSGSYAIVVDKYAGKCYVYKGRTLVEEFDAELGRVWKGDKQYQGDDTTPEGIYHITRKLGRGETRYYKALLINYPNEDDKKRFELARENGTIPKSSKIGGLIEIHGMGGRGVDWTEGCVALENRDMDKLFNMAKVGTRVTIVGSLLDLESVKRRQ